MDKIRDYIPTKVSKSEQITPFKEEKMPEQKYAEQKRSKRGVSQANVKE